MLKMRLKIDDFLLPFLLSFVPFEFNKFFQFSHKDSCARKGHGVFRGCIGSYCGIRIKTSSQLS